MLPSFKQQSISQQGSGQDSPCPSNSPTAGAAPQRQRKAPADRKVPTRTEACVAHGRGSAPGTVRGGRQSLHLPRGGDLPALLGTPAVLHNTPQWAALPRPWGQCPTRLPGPKEAVTHVVVSFQARVPGPPSTPPPKVMATPLLLASVPPRPPVPSPQPTRSRRAALRDPVLSVFLMAAPRCPSPGAPLWDRL